MNKQYERNLDMKELLRAEQKGSSRMPKVKNADPKLSGSIKDDSETSEVEESSTTDTSRINSIFAESVLEKVASSWELISVNKDAVGLDFFIRVLTENPEMLQLFSFGSQLAGQHLEVLRTCKSLQAHASSVMEFMGKGIAGLSNIDALIPDLRALGKTHVKAGVLTSHYDMFFRHLMEAFAAELKDNWDRDTENAWAHVFNGMKTVMDQPEMLNQTEPLSGWGLGVALSSLFIAFIAPIRLAGFLAPLSPLTTAVLDCVELVALFILTGDLASPWIVRLLRNDQSASKKRKMTKRPLLDKIDQLLFPLKFFFFRTVYSLHLERWVPWPRIDALILVSYLLQNLNRSVGSFSLYTSDVGVSWLHATGLFRIVAIVRVSYFARCAENAVILKQATTDHWRRVVTISNLLFTLIYVTHVSACIWCIVARVELGSRVTEPAGSEFFPDAGLLMGRSSGALKAYLRAIYWAWVNLAGTGNVDSVPTQPVEICATLLVHLCGASLYAIVTGHVVSILDDFTQKENQVGNDLAELRAFMQECDMSPATQDRIMHGYVTQHLMQREGDLLSVPSLKDDVGRRLPTHFRQDLEIHASAVALQRRNKLLKNCSTDLLFAIASSLTGTMTRLPGDYLFQAGEKVKRRFCMIVKGSLEIIEGDESIGTLERGSAIGIGWLVEATLRPEAKASFPRNCEFADWLRKDGTAYASIRATSDCVIVFGLLSPLEIEALQRRFPRDFSRLEAERIAAAHKANTALDVIHAVAALKKRNNRKLLST